MNASRRLVMIAVSALVLTIMTLMTTTLVKPQSTTVLSATTAVESLVSGTYEYLTPYGAEVLVKYSGQNHYTRQESYDGVMENGFAIYNGDTYDIDYISRKVFLNRGAGTQPYTPEPIFMDVAILERIQNGEAGVRESGNIDVGPPAEKSSDAAEIPVPTSLELEGPSGGVERWEMTTSSAEVDETPKALIERLLAEGFILEEAGTPIAPPEQPAGTQPEG